LVPEGPSARGQLPGRLALRHHRRNPCALAPPDPLPGALPPDVGLAAGLPATGVAAGEPDPCRPCVSPAR